MTNEERILKLLEAQQAEFRKINTRLDSMDARLDGMDARFDGIDAQLVGVRARLNSMDARLDKLEEDAEITRDGVNTLIEWAENVSNAIRFPLPRLK